MGANRFFSFDGECYDTHPTAEEARAVAQRALESYADSASDGWDDAVERVLWGEVRQHVVEVSRVTLAQAEADGDEAVADRMRGEGWDSIVEYDLVDVVSEGGDT